jgi:hypothetical protein
MNFHNWDRDRDRALARARGFARDLDQIFERNDGRDLARALAADLAFHLDLALDDVYGRLFDRDLSELELERELERARDEALALARDLASDLDLELDRRDLIRDLCSMVQFARFANRPRSNLIQEVSPEEIPDTRLQESRRITPPARGLLAAAVRLLPPANRDRYAEEYRSELWEITHARASSRQQTRYALNQLARAAHLRSALLTPRRKNAAP